MQVLDAGCLDAGSLRLDRRNEAIRRICHPPSSRPRSRS